MFVRSFSLENMSTEDWLSRSIHVLRITKLLKNENPTTIAMTSNKYCRYITDEVSGFIIAKEMGNSNILKVFPGHRHQHKCDRQE